MMLESVTGATLVGAESAGKDGFDGLTAAARRSRKYLDIKISPPIHPGPDGYDETVRC
jgi:hypothetical protein